jgi:hypothetical protein
MAGGFPFNFLFPAFLSFGGVPGAVFLPEEFWKINHSYFAELIL